MNLREAAAQVVQAYDAHEPLAIVMEDLRAALAEPEDWELRRLRKELERCKATCAATAEAWREEAGCDHCRSPLWCGTKCKSCGRKA